MDHFWASLCLNGSSKNQRRVTRLSHRRKTAVESPLLSRARRVSSTVAAATKRSSFSAPGNFSRSFPSATARESTTDLFREFSLEDFAMHNNYTVIGNKVAPVIIRNCAEEYQMTNNRRNESGQLHSHYTAHDLLMDKFFLLKDSFVGIDRHNTIEEHGVPNLHAVNVKPTIYAIGQPTMNGLEKFSVELLEKHEFVYYVNVRALPTLFLRRSGDFIPYSAYIPKRRGEAPCFFTSETALLDAEREMQLQALNIARMNGGLFYFYNVLDASPDEPHMYQISTMEDLVTSRQLFSKVQSDHTNFRYKRMVLPDCEDPTIEWMDSLVDLMKEIKNHEAKNVALVFQCLTGEGAARLAAMVALLSLDNPQLSLDQSEEKMTNRIRDIQSKIPWRNCVMDSIVASTRMQNARNEVDCALARLSTVEGMYSFTSNMNPQKGYMCMAGRGDVNTPSTTTMSAGGNPFFRSESVSNMSLRELSEMSISSLGTDNSDGKAAYPTRFEFVDEEKLMTSLLYHVDIYCLFLVFRCYAIDQRPHSFRLSFASWLAYKPHYLFDLSQANTARQNMAELDVAIPYWQLRFHEGVKGEISMDPTFHRVAGCPIFGIAQTTGKRFRKIVKKLCGAQTRKKYKHLYFINVRDDSVFYHYPRPADQDIPDRSAANGRDTASLEKETLWEFALISLPCMFGARTGLVNKIEERLATVFTHHPDSLSLVDRVQTVPVCPGTWKSTNQLMLDIKSDETVNAICSDIKYRRIPIPKYRIPRFECFDDLVSTVRDAIEIDSDTAFVFFCHNGKKRTTNMMVAASLVLLHMKIFDIAMYAENTETSDFCVPEFNKGEYKVILELIQVLPGCHVRKKEVDKALDICHEDMSTMHYHLREHLNPCFEKARRATDFDNYITLKHRAYLGLELYAFLIIFNCYLYQEKEHLWRRLSFAQWMSTYAAPLGVLNILNNFGYTQMGQDYPLNMMRSRWMDTSVLLEKTSRNCPEEADKGQDDDNASLATFGKANSLNMICEH